MKDLSKITTEMLEHICDKLCIYPRTVTDQDELDGICAECRMEQFARQIEEAVK